MESSGKLKVSTPNDLEVVMVRELNAPRRLVWEAMTRPEWIRRWLFLPPGWAMEECREDIRVGGKFRWTWTGPDGGTAMVMFGEYREVVPEVRLVRSERIEFGDPPQVGEQEATMEFEEKDGRTVVRITARFPSKEARDAAIASGMEFGVGAGYDQLEKLLAEENR